jgi:hypothetical protein
VLRKVMPIVLLALALTATPARAETLTVAAGGDPVAGLPNGIDYEYDTAGVQLGLEVLARPADGPPCQPTIVMDQAAVGPSGGAVPVTSSPLQLTGNGLGRVPFTFATAGRWRICAWLYRTPDDAVAAAANEAGVRAPATSLAVSAEAVGASAGGADLRARVTGSVEAASDVFTIVVPGGTACPPSYDEDTQPTVLDVLPAGTATRVSGAFDLRFGTRDRLGLQPWRVCAYVQAGASAPTATAVASAVVDVVLKPALLRRPRVRAAKGMLTCDGGRFRARPAAKTTYAWVRGGTPIPGARGRTLRVTKKLEGKAVACRVTATNKLGQTTATSRTITAR